MFFKKKDRVSVIIPAYNHERFVGQALESLLNQTIKIYEIIVVDDGSTDRTGEVVKSVSDPRIQYVYQENQDAFNALNHGFQRAGGDFIAILNSDDLYHESRLARLLESAKKNGAACVFSDVQPIDENGAAITDPGFWWNVWHKKNKDFYFKCQDLYTAFLNGNFMVGTSNLFLRADAVRKVGGFAALRYLHDYDYIFRVMLAYPGKVVYLHDEKLLFYRLHGDNTLSEAAVTGREQDKEVIRKYLLEKLPGPLRPLVAAGADRLVELEKELFQVRARFRAR
ncbi:MAG: glycosyltransferase [Deltaproteobacteria bacterium]|nr:glycosyltransferase [Deltaproteobacteria bacterium]